MARAARPPSPPCWNPRCSRRIYGDELGEDLPLLFSLAIVAYNPLQETLRTDESAFWDDVTTPETETPAAIWARALRSARTALDAQGDDVRLDQIRSVRFTHAFDTLPLLGDLFSVGPIGVGGSSDTIDVVKTLPQEPGKGLFGASTRVVATPADWSRTRGTLTLGQSGHRFSPYRPTNSTTGWRCNPIPGPGTGRTQNTSSAICGSIRSTPVPCPLQGTHEPLPAPCLPISMALD
jgi:penicillin G amidase